MSEFDNEFQIRPGRIKTTRSPKPKPFIQQVLKAAQKAGHTSGTRPRQKFSASGQSSFGKGRGRLGRSFLFNPQRRVTVKARIARHSGKAYRAAPLSAHLKYLKRDGVTQEGERGIMFDAEIDRADDLGFAKRCDEDRHHFRFIVSPEDGTQMSDLKAFTRDLAKQMEADLGTKLDWVAVDHWNTDNPHVHLLVRGVDQSGADLVISRDYISRGLRSRAEDLVSIELGPKQAHEIKAELQKEITAERWTRLDREIAFHADEVGALDVSFDNPAMKDADRRQLMIGRLQHLEKMGLATELSPTRWQIGLEAQPVLRDMGMRGDIIKTMHKAMAERGLDRGSGNYVIDGGGAGPPILGRLVEKGLHNELTGEAYVVIDGTDGRAHHVRLRGVQAMEQAPEPGGIVELRRLGGSEGRQPYLVINNRSDLDLAAQVKADGATWLDHRLVELTPTPLATAGFGCEVLRAMEQRIEHLEEEGLAKRRGNRVIYQRRLLGTLREKELENVATEIAGETGLKHMPTEAGSTVAGVCRRQLNLASGRFAMVEDGLGFRLVPWANDLSKKLGQQVSGVAKDKGGINWSFGRKRGIGL